MSFDLMIRKNPPAPRSAALIAAAVGMVEALPHAHEMGEIYDGETEPSDLDTMTVEEMVEDGEAPDFAGFCSARGLKPKSDAAAAAYLDEKWGAALVILSLKGRDRERMAQFYAGLVALAREHGWRIENPQDGEDIDLANPGLVPPGY